MANEVMCYELQEMIIEACHLQEDIPDNVAPDSPLIGADSPLGLDSLDAVEIVVAVQKKYGVRIGGQQSGRDVLQSLSTLADFITVNSR
ncbi:MAG: acyl carrier protein [Desulfobacteraceae bacterium 4572_35.1]|nr:MAG: acyl carrier protein [Desulfobacteraceae bacterium 4572_35.1]